MKRQIQKILLLSSLLVLLAAPLCVSGSVAYADLTSGAQKREACDGVGLGTNGCSSSATNAKNINHILGAVVQILSLIIGIAAVIVIMIQGFRFITSGGDSNTVANARQAILYAVIGLVIAAVAQLLVHFVIYRTS